MFRSASPARQETTLRAMLVACVMVAACGTTREVLAQTYSVTEVISYHDNATKWVLGQSASLICSSAIPASAACDGNDVVSSSTFDPVSALPVAHSSFGRLLQTLTYNADGTVATVKDGNNNITTLSNWKRGIPQSIRYPATHEYPSGAITSAEVDNNGWILSVTDELGARTCYEHDAMGRVNLILHPSEIQGSSACDDSAWEETSIEFRPMLANEWRPPGVDAGQWRQYTTTGNYQKLTYFDALWRPVLTHEYDAANTSGTLRAVSISYDAAGHTAFQSYPSSEMIPPATGIWTFYDDLGRVKEVRQDSEIGPLITRTEYLGLQRRVIGPNNEQSLTNYQAFDQPSYELPVQVDEPLGRTTRIPRDPFGKPLEIVRTQ